MEFQLTPGPPCEIYIVPSGFTTYCNIWLQALEIPSQINPLYSRGSGKRLQKSPLYNQTWQTFCHFILGVDIQSASYSRAHSLDSLKFLHLFFPSSTNDDVYGMKLLSCQTGNWESLHYYTTLTGDSLHTARELSSKGFPYIKYPYLQRLEPWRLTSQSYFDHGGHVEL